MTIQNSRLNVDSGNVYGVLQPIDLAWILIALRENDQSILVADFDI